MNDRDPRASRHAGSPRGELVLIVAVAVLLVTIALLRVAVERERALGTGELGVVQLLSGSSVAEASEGVRTRTAKE